MDNSIERFYFAKAESLNVDYGAIFRNYSSN